MKYCDAECFFFFKQKTAYEMLRSLVGGSQQLDLFNDDAEMTSLYGAIDGIRKKFGENSILKARCI